MTPFQAREYQEMAKKDALDMARLMVQAKRYDTIFLLYST